VTVLRMRVCFVKTAKQANSKVTRFPFVLYGPGLGWTHGLLTKKAVKIPWFQ